MSKKRKVIQHRAPLPSKASVADVAEPRIHGHSQVTLQAGEAAALTGRATVTVTMGTAWLSGKVLAPGASASLSADAKFGGPLHIEALPDQQQVPLAATGCVKLDIESTADDHLEGSQADGRSYKVQLVPSVQMASRRYPQHWLQATEDIVQSGREGGSPSVAVVGSKGVGKSTLARLLVNSLLEVSPVVAFLDTDSGQSELTVPGLVSLTLLDKPLFGPAHMHMQQPTKSHFIGDLSPQSNPLHYLSSIRSLHEWYWNHSGTTKDGETVRPPLVINTHGWIKGLGFELLAQVLESTCPSHVLQLDTNNANSSLPPCVWWLPEDVQSHQRPAVYQLPSVGAVQQGMGNDVQDSPVSSWAPRQPPSEQRALQWLAFARQCTGHHLNSCSWELPAFATAADDLACSPPYRVPVSHFNVIFHEASIAAPQVLQALSGSLVALTKAAGDALAGNKHAGAAATTAVSECLGIGIVRSVDPVKQLLYILTPTPFELLQQATTLEVGKLELPLALLQTSTFLSPYISVWSITADGTGAGVMKARNTLLRNRLKPKQ
ncbi:hypothetical protein WJX82_006257 [Trebouxia sp. C0006]